VESDATEPPEQALTEALLSLSWPLPRTIEDADAALTRLEEVRAVLVRLDQQSMGDEAWWAGQVDALATQSGFVLEWWRPVLRDPELEWTLNHQAHLTADLATLASAGARLLDQIEPQSAQEASAPQGRRAAGERRWGPAAVPPFAPAGANAPGARPQPPAEVFGDIPPPPLVQPQQQPTPAPAPAPAPAAQALPQAMPDALSADDLEPPQFPPVPADPMSTEPPPPEALNAGAARHRRPSYDFDDPDAPVPAPVAPVGLTNTTAPTPAPMPMPMPAAAPPPAAVPMAPPAPGPMPGQMPPAAAPLGALGQPGMPPGAEAPAGVPGQRDPGQRDPGRQPGAYMAPPPPGYSPGHGYPDDADDDEPASLVPTGLRRHQRRLLIQTGAILAAVGTLCWWAVYSLSSNPSHPAASSSTTHPAGGSTAQGGIGAPSGTQTSAAPSPSGTASQSPHTPTTSAAPAPSTATSSVADATTVSSVQVTLLGGSSAVPQIVVLITVHTAGTGAINVSGTYYGAKSGGGKVAEETMRWTFSGHTAYQYSVPIANSAYCGTTFSFTLNAGGRSDAGTTSPGC